MTIQRWKSDWTTVWNSSTPVQFTETQAEKQEVLYLAADKTATSWGSVGSGEGSVDAGMAAKALEGLMTCSESPLYGYEAFSGVNSSFIKNGETWKTSGNLSDVNINDYATQADYGTLANKTTSVNAYVKYTRLQSLYNAAHP